MANYGNPHEQAFHRWSIPDFGGEPSAPARQGQSFAFAPTVRGEPLDLKQPPPSFRVYTPSTGRPASLRPGRIAPKMGEDDGINARVLLKWTGIGIVAGFAVLAALIVILSFADDTHAPTSARSAVAANINTPATPPKPVQATAPVPQAARDIELAPAPPPKAKKKKTKKS